MIALDPATDNKLWAFPTHKLDRAKPPYGDGLINRGLATGAIPRRARPPTCSLMEATLDPRLVAVDAATGAACPGFGANGEVSLRDVARYTPGRVPHDLADRLSDSVVVVGSAIDDNSARQHALRRGRGFDAKTGKALVVVGTAAKPKNANPGTWNTGAANAWSVLSADPARHTVLVPTGSASPDYWGGLRPGDNRWANSVVALDVKTGKLKWGFQLTRP